MSEQPQAPAAPVDQLKTCFVIMPISEIESYGPGHFKRVYEHVIKPACFKAGFMPIRADEVQQANVIVIDILKRIIESDMVICDLSSKNANVFYELGIRQAFGLPAVLIKDKQTGRVFDISALRDCEYDESLRIDMVDEAVDAIADQLVNTYNSHLRADGQINSLIKLLNVPAAQLPQQTNINSETRLILESIENIANRITRVEDKVTNQIVLSNSRLNAYTDNVTSTTRLGKIISLANDIERNHNPGSKSASTAAAYNGTLVNSVPIPPDAIKVVVPNAVVPKPPTKDNKDN